MPSLSIGHRRIKLRQVDGTWRVLLPVTREEWLAVATTRHATYIEAWRTAKLWAKALKSPPLSEEHP